MTNADVALWAQRPDGNGAVEQFITQGLLNDPNARPLVQHMAAYVDPAFEYRRRVFEAKKAGASSVPTGSVIAPIPDDDDDDDDDEGDPIDLGALPDSLIKYIDTLDLPDDAIDAIENIWFDYPGNRDFINSRLSLLNLDKGLMRRVEGKIIRHLVQLGLVLFVYIICHC